jgi:hypothetical protein
MEKPKHKVWEATCLECGEVISNPICPGCLADEMEDLLGREHPEAQLVVREARNAFETAGNELTTCILCGNQINICPYCFMEDMRLMLTDAYPKTGDKLTEDYGYGDITLE